MRLAGDHPSGAPGKVVHGEVPSLGKRLASGCYWKQGLRSPPSQKCGVLLCVTGAGVVSGASCVAWRWVVSSLDGWSCGAFAVHGAEGRVCRAAPELGHQPALSRAPGYVAAARVKR